MPFLGDVKDRAAFLERRVFCSVVALLLYSRAGRPKHAFFVNNEVKNLLLWLLCVLSRQPKQAFFNSIAKNFLVVVVVVVFLYVISTPQKQAFFISNVVSEFHFLSCFSFVCMIKSQPKKKGILQQRSKKVSGFFVVVVLHVCFSAVVVLVFLLMFSLTVVN